MAPKYQYRYADGTIGDSPWKRGADGKPLLNREGGFLEEGAYIGYVDAAGQTVQGLPPETGSVVMGYADADERPGAAGVSKPSPAMPASPLKAAPPTAAAPAAKPRLSLLQKLTRWLARIFS